MRLALLFLSLSGCMWVFDLDAEPGNSAQDGAADAQGGAASVGGSGAGNDGGGGPTTAGNSQGGSGPGGNSQGGSNQGGNSQGGGGGGIPCDDGSMAFDGTQSVGVNDPNELLKLQDDVSLGAWVLPQSFAGDQQILSRLSADKGYALLLVHASGQLFPAVRVNNGDECTCVSSVPVSTRAWSHVAANFTKPTARVWLDGVQVCSQSCGNNDIATEQANPRVGSNLAGDGEHFRGLLDDVFVQAPGATPPPMLDGGGCGSNLKLLLAFDSAPSQQFTPECTAGMQATLGEGSASSTDDPTFQSCP